MTRSFPPLHTLVAFEAAARHLSFTEAAEELFVTPGAISHQIKALEAYLGLKLFHRLPRALALTGEGQSYLIVVRDTLDRLSAATVKLQTMELQGILTVSVLPSFAARWLVPRLGGFRALYPDIDVRIAPTPELVDFARTDVDVGIRYGGGQYAGLQADRLFSEEVFPVCSPSLVAGPHPLHTPQDLRAHTLLHDEGHDGWRTWLLAAGVHELDPQRGPIFTDSSMLVQAAVSGQGVALGRRVLATADLQAGRLVRVFAQTLPTEFAYYVVCPKAAAARARIKAFREWILNEAQRDVLQFSCEREDASA
jgi:LysR family glycine cleavage system transcriptional activator